MIKLQDHFLLTRPTEPVRMKQDLQSLKASGESYNVHLWYVPRFELFQNCMETKGLVPFFIGVVIPGSVRLAFWGGSVYTTQSSCNHGRGFPLWLVEGNEVGPILLPLLDPLVLSPLCGRLMPRKRLHQFNRRLCKRLSRFETRSCFQAY